MGMASSQARLCSLTSRQADIRLRLTDISNKNMSLTRDMNKLSLEYQRALNSKTYKWTNNGGVSYVDLSYNNLMRPSDMNLNKAYLLTNQNGRILIDDKYKKYAEMISPDGLSGGDWESNRTAILAELLGMDESSLSTAVSLQENVWELKDQVEAKKAEKPAITSTYGNVGDILGTFAKTSANFEEKDDWESAYNSNDYVNVGDANSAETNLKQLMTNLGENLAEVLGIDKDHERDKYDKFMEKITDTYISGYIGNFKDSPSDKDIENMKKGSPVWYDKDTYYVSVKEIINNIFAASGAESTSSGSYKYYNINDTKGDDSYAATKAEYYVWEGEYEALLEQYEAAQNECNSALPANTERLISFYDDLFSAIADKGWEHNNSLNDTSYLNEMLQNNIYTLTTVDRAVAKDDNGEYSWTNEYDTDIASNFMSVVSVRDDDAVYEAQAEYEYKKGLINSKQKKNDIAMEQLSTKGNAIKTEKEKLQEIIGKHIERTFNVFG